MDFGKVSLEELETTDLSLPGEPAWNKRILVGQKLPNPTIYLGCAKWGRTEWIGKIYPEGTKEANFLDHYVQHYNSIELNATHYKIYTPEAIQKWADKAVGRQFLFCPKVPQTISHYSSFVNVAGKTNDFLKGIYALGEHLGPVFLQVSDKFTPKRKDNLYKYIEQLPLDVQFFLEVRNAEWFANKSESDDLLTTLKRLNVGYVITDAAGRRDCVHMHLTVPKTFIRFVGNSLHPTDYNRIDEWVKRISYWLDNGLQELYFFMHMHDEAFSPELTEYLVEQLNKKCGLSLQNPLFLSEPIASKIVKRKVSKPTQESNGSLF